MNLIFIMLDSLRQDHVSLYNQGEEVFPGIPACKTPHLDEFSKESIVFDNVYPCGLPTIPVRYELMTGQYSLPYRPWCPLTPYDVTISTLLKKEGYISALITDTYHYRAPNMNYHRDFTLYQWIRGQEYDPHRVPFPRRKIEDYVNEHYPEFWRKRIAQFLANTDDLKEDNWFTQQVVEESIRFLKEARGKGKVFLWLDSFEPHEPWDPPPRFDTYTDKNYRGPRLIMPMGGRALDWATEEEIRFIRGLYAGEVSFVDYCMGKLFSALKDLGYLEDSLIVITADHGHPLADHGKFLKSPERMFNELLRVPFMIRLPEGAYGGRRISALIQFPDVLPTLLDILGLGNNNIPLAGKSFWKVIKGEEEEHREAIIAGYHDSPIRCIRDKEWSFVYMAGEGPDLLFNLKEDPREKVNLIDKYPDICRRLREKFGNIFFPQPITKIKGLQGIYEMASSSLD